MAKHFPRFIDSNHIKQVIGMRYLIRRVFRYMAMKDKTILEKIYIETIQLFNYSKLHVCSDNFIYKLNKRQVFIPADSSIVMYSHMYNIWKPMLSFDEKMENIDTPFIGRIEDIPIPYDEKMANIATPYDKEMTYGQCVGKVKKAMRTLVNYYNSDRKKDPLKVEVAKYFQKILEIISFIHNYILIIKPPEFKWY